MTGARCSSPCRAAYRFETLKAKSLREEYLQRLAARKDRLLQATRRTGWQLPCASHGPAA
jgi:hypothetical protein